jgi:hypothetical protein
MKAQLFADSVRPAATNVSPSPIAALNQVKAHAKETRMTIQRRNSLATPRHEVTGASRQRGQGMSEYIIITALVAVAGIGLFAAFGDVLQNQMAGMSREMAGQSASQDISDAQTSATTAQTRAAQTDSLSTYNQQTNAAQ